VCGLVESVVLPTKQVKAAGLISCGKFGTGRVPQGLKPDSLGTNLRPD
jgi:hypothetical protein